MNAGPWFIKLLQRSANPEPEFIAGQNVLRYAMGVRIFSVGIFLALIPATYVSFFGTSIESLDYQEPDITTMAISLFFLAIGTYLALGTNISKIAYNDDNIFLHSPWARTKCVPWSSVQSYSRADNDVCVKTDTHGCFCVSFLMNGVSSFQNMLAQHATFHPDTDKHRAKC